jgi:hypothetical protein
MDIIEYSQGHNCDCVPFSLPYPISSVSDTIQVVTLYSALANREYPQPPQCT